MSDLVRWPSQTAEARAQRRRQIAYGQWQPYVDAEPARQHVLKLRESGMGPVTIARLSGVPHGSLAKLIYGDAQRGLAPSKRIRPETAAKILAVHPRQQLLAGAAKVAAFGTQRRIQALHAFGWPLAEVARRIGVSRQGIDRILQREYVQAATARMVDDVFRELSTTPGPSAQACRLAASKGYKPPAWWDDIDDPKVHGHRVDVPPPVYGPTGQTRRRRRPLTAPAVDSDVRQRMDTLSASEREVLLGLASGETPEQVATNRGKAIATIRTQIKAIVKKLDTTGYPAAIALAWRAGWLVADAVEHADRPPAEPAAS